MTVLVTGGVGAIGSNVARILLAKGQRVIVLDRVPLSPDHRILKGFDESVLKSEVGTISDTATIFDVLKQHDVDGIIHVAGMLPPHQCDIRPIDAINTNIVGTANVLEAGRVFGVSSIVVASAAGVMGRPKDVLTPRKEEDVILPLAGIYQMTKLAVEQMVYSYRQLWKMNVSTVRPRNVYGPGAAPRVQPLFEMFFAAVAGKDFVRKAGGDSTFDYTYVKDLAKGVVQLFELKSSPFYVYNLSRGRATKMSEVAAAMQKLFPKQKIEVGPGPWEGVVEGGKEFELTVHPAVMPPQDTSRAAKDFGYKAEWDIEHGLADWARWYRTGEYETPAGAKVLTG